MPPPGSWCLRCRDQRARERRALGADLKLQNPNQKIRACLLPAARQRGVAARAAPRTHSAPPLPCHVLLSRQRGGLSPVLVPCRSGRSQRVKVIVQVEAVGIIAVFIGRDRSDVVSEILSVPQQRMMLFLGEK